MKARYDIIKKMVSVLICMALLFSYLPIATLAATPETNYYNREVDNNTMDNWTQYFDLEKWGTANAGGVWTDKSVFKDAEAFGGKISMTDGDKNFLTALSTIAANKEIVGYSTVPTDTVFVLDLSNSMSANDIVDLVDATNKAITDLLAINQNNRVGVVLYSGTSANRGYENAVAALMPIDRYTTTKTETVTINNQNTTVGAYIECTQNGAGTVRLATRNNNLAVSGTGGSIVTESKSVGGATYIQAGLWEAYQLFDAVPDSDIYIEHNNWQSGDYRMPIVVLMSDGAPTLGTSYFDDVANSTYGNAYQNAGKANVGNGDDENITAGQGFLVQLTASYIKNRIENKYKVHTADGAGRSLFYTLGFNIGNSANNIAYSVLNPDASTVTDSFWNTYNANNSMQVRTKGRNNYNNNEFINVTVYKNSYTTSKNYVDEYFSASGDGLTAAFEDIVNEIILQSRYYPTHLEGGSPDFSGYVTFTDTLGEYMEVKSIKGILLGNTLFDGHMMASKFADSSSGGLGTVENPTALGDEFIRAVKTRLGIAETADAHLLVAKAFADGQLAYNGADDWSNYIAWYAKADGSYAGFYDKDGTEPVPADAVFINRSYGFLGETGGSIKNSDMMYMSVQIHENIETGEQTVIWKVPAALVPMITYKVTLQGTSPELATDVNVTVEEATPVRLVYETGLRSDLNEFNITKISGENISGATTINDERHIAADGHTRLFWNNSFDITGENHDNHKVAISEFTPNKENERFYYPHASAVFKKVGEDRFEIVPQSEQLSENGEYYHRRFNFENYPAGTAAADKKTKFTYEKMSKASIRAAVWQDNFELLDHNVTGAYVVPKGTPARELQMFDEPKAVNKTQSANMVFHPYLSEQNSTVYVDMNLGNNGILSVTPATGIKISKTVDVFEVGTDDTFKFRVTLDRNGSFDSYLTAIGETPSGNPTTATFGGGVYEFEMKKDQTLWISGIPAGAVYTVEEISTNEDYKIKSVHVNGASLGGEAYGTVAQYLIDDIEFVNTAISEGDLVITKQVEDAAGNRVDINDNITFTAEVTLTNKRGEAVSGTFETSKGSITIGADGKFTVSLKEKESFVVRGIPEETNYSVVETNIPNGFALNAQKSELSGVVDATSNDMALIVNTYNPTAATGNGVNVDVTKTISGNRTHWVNGEVYSFVVTRVGANAPVGRVTISNTDANKTKSVSLANETYDAAGTYYYTVTETAGNQGGITYDNLVREFAVVVADADMDGDLEITAVNNIANTTVSGRWRVSTNFNNVYAPTGFANVAIAIQKEINDNHSLSGFRFALYDRNPNGSSEAVEITRSALTNSLGETRISMTYPASVAKIGGTEFTYYLAEVSGNNPNITYTDKVYEVKVTVTDNGDGTISAQAKVYDGAAEVTAPEVVFTNVYTPSTSDFVTFSGQKEIISDVNRVLNANEFTFKLEAVGAAPLPANKVATNSVNGSFEFEPIEFTGAGEYKYVITEDATNQIGGFTYDDARYEITVTVADAFGALTANITSMERVEADNSRAPVTDILFQNEYKVDPAIFNIDGTKLLTGKTMRGGEFEFNIEAVTALAPLPAQTTVKNAIDGKFDFGQITFNNPGTFVYKITEVNGGGTGYIYDNSVYTLTVRVTDNAEGELYLGYSIEKDSFPSREIVFRNAFVPTAYTYDIDLQIGINKTLNGRVLKDGEFEFVLINAINGEQIGEAVKNNAQGNIDFPELTLHEEGTYHYKVAEIVGDEKGISYDNIVYHVVLGLEVVDDATAANDGQFQLVREELHKAVIVIDESGEQPVETTVYENITGESIEFVNTYTPNPADIILGGTKNLVGRELKDGEFTFNLYFAKFDAQNNKWVRDELVEQVQNDENGNFVFETRVAEGNTEYIYFITEDATNPKANVTYDATEYMVVVRSVDNLDGTLTVNYEYTVNGEAVEDIVFTNTYAQPTPDPIPTPTPTPDPQPEPDPEPKPEVQPKPETKPETKPEAQPQPKPEGPKTGDNSNLALWFALLVCSGTGILGATFFEKKKKA